MDRSESDVIAEADNLLRETQKVRSEAERYELLHGMYLFPKLPDDLARDEGVYILSPDLIHEVRELKAKILGFDTEIQCIPTNRTAQGTIARETQNKVDELEKAAAVFLYRLDPDNVINGRVVHNQLIAPAAITILEMGAIDTPDPSQRFPWKWFDVDFDGCGWLEEEETPTIFSRKYWEYIKTVEDKYSGLKDGPGEGRYLRNEEGAWQWKLSDDVGQQRGNTVTDGGRSYERCEKVWLDDGQMIYHVALNSAKYNEARFNIGPMGIGRSEKRTGKIIWCGSNPFGRVSAFLTGSNVTPSRYVQDRWLPHFLDYITTTEQENVVASTRATAARNRAAPRDYWKPDPEVLKNLISTYGDVSKIPGTEWGDGRTPLGYGELKSREVNIDPDIANLDARLNERKQRYSAGSMLKSPDVIEHSTAAAVLAGYDSENESISMVVARRDILKRQLIECWENSIKWLGQHYPSYAKFQLEAMGLEPSLHGGAKVNSGDKPEITPKSFEVGHKWYVVTRQRSRGQAQAEFNAAVEGFMPLPDGRPNIGVYDDLFRAKGVSDVRERIVTLAKEAFLYDPEYTAYIDNFVKAAIEFELEAESGIRVGLLPAGQPPAVEPPPDTVGEGPNTGTQTNSPVTEPAEGGSGGEMIAG